MATVCAADTKPSAKPAAPKDMQANKVSFDLSADAVGKTAGTLPDGVPPLYEFDRSSMGLPTGAPVGEPLGSVLADDRDEGMGSPGQFDNDE